MAFDQNAFYGDAIGVSFGNNNAASDPMKAGSAKTAGATTNAGAKAQATGTQSGNQTVANAATAQDSGSNGTVSNNIANGKNTVSGLMGKMNGFGNVDIVPGRGSSNKSSGSTSSSSGSL